MPTKITTTSGRGTKANNTNKLAPSPIKISTQVDDLTCRTENQNSHPNHIMENYEGEKYQQLNLITTEALDVANNGLIRTLLTPRNASEKSCKNASLSQDSYDLRESKNMKDKYPHSLKFASLSIDTSDEIGEQFCLSPTIKKKTLTAKTLSRISMSSQGTAGSLSIMSTSTAPPKIPRPMSCRRLQSPSPTTIKPALPRTPASRESDSSIFNFSGNSKLMVFLYRSCLL